MTFDKIGGCVGTRDLAGLTHVATRLCFLFDRVSPGVGRRVPCMALGPGRSCSRRSCVRGLHEADAGHWVSLTDCQPRRGGAAELARGRFADEKRRGFQRGIGVSGRGQATRPFLSLKPAQAVPKRRGRPVLSNVQRRRGLAHEVKTLEEVDIGTENLAAHRYGFRELGLAEPGALHHSPNDLKHSPPPQNGKSSCFPKIHSSHEIASVASFRDHGKQRGVLQGVEMVLQRSPRAPNHAAQG